MNSFPDEGDEKKWHVIYMKTRYEKRAYDDLSRRGIEAFLPLKKELHHWSDRKKWIDVPLFSSYVFVNIVPQERGRVYFLDGFVRFVTMNGKPSIVPGWQIEYVRRVVSSYPEAVDALGKGYVGRKGVITAGPLAGMKGEIVELLNNHWFVIRIDGLEKVLAVRVPVSIVEAVVDFPFIAGSEDPTIHA